MATSLLPLFEPPEKNGAAAPLAGLGERASMDYTADIVMSNTALRKGRAAARGA